MSRLAPRPADIGTATASSGMHRAFGIPSGPLEGPAPPIRGRKPVAGPALARPFMPKPRDMAPGGTCDSPERHLDRRVMSPARAGEIDVGLWVKVATPTDHAQTAILPWALNAAAFR